VGWRGLTGDDDDFVFDSPTVERWSIFGEVDIRETTYCPAEAPATFLIGGRFSKALVSCEGGESCWLNCCSRRPAASAIVKEYDLDDTEDS